MILINNSSFYDDVFLRAHRDDVVVIPAPSHCYGYSKLAEGLSTKEAYQLIPSSLVYFIEQYAGSPAIEDYVELAKCMQGYTPGMFNNKVVDRNLNLGRSLPYNSTQPKKLKTESHPQAPTIIMQTVVQNLFGNRQNNTYLHDSSDDGIKTALFNCINTAIRQCRTAVDSFKSTIYVAPLFLEPGYKDDNSKLESEWSTVEGYLENMVNWLGLYTHWKDNNIVLYVK